jgi:phosphate transport system permease protein
MQTMNKLYAARRRKNSVTMALSLAATLLGLGWLVLILGVLLYEGFSGLSLRVFTEMTPPPGAAGGLLNAIMGSLVLTGLAVLIGTPIGILAGTYMAEYGRHDRLTSVVRFVNDILLSAPSIVIGLFIYEVMVARMGHFSGYAGAVARISGETAPLLFTALNNQFWSANLNGPIASLPVVIFQFALSPYKDWQQLAWTGALVITLAVLALSIVARLLATPRTSK